MLAGTEASSGWEWKGRSFELVSSQISRRGSRPPSTQKYGCDVTLAHSYPAVSRHYRWRLGSSCPANTSDGSGCSGSKRLRCDPLRLPHLSVAQVCHRRQPPPPPRTGGLRARHPRRCARLRGTPVQIPHIHNLQFRILNSCNLHNVPPKAAFEIAIPVDRYRDSRRDARFRVYPMAALDPPQLPAPRLENPTALFAGDGLHTAISINRSVPDRGTS